MKYRTILTVEILHGIDVDHLDLSDLDLAYKQGEIDYTMKYSKSKQIEEGEE